MNIDVVIFDLDDTLYNEIDYVKSGFKAVSSYFASNYKIDENRFFSFMIKTLEKFGRGKVFDITLEHFSLNCKKNVKKALSVYRNHQPTITLPQESIEILQWIQSHKIPMYIITDGNKIVQTNKLKALNMDIYVKKSLPTHQYGSKYAKPSKYCFEKIASWEKKCFSKIVYIGDNPNKDFINIKKLGFQTIRIKQGMFKNLKLSKEYEADKTIKNICELKKVLSLNSI